MKRDVYHASHAFHALHACLVPSNASYAWGHLFKRGKRSKEKSGKQREKNNKQVNELARLGKCFVFEAGVMGSNLQFSKRKVASCDQHCNFGKTLSFNLIHILIIFVYLFDHTLFLPLILACLSLIHYF